MAVEVEKRYDDTIKRIGRAGFRATELIAWDDDAFTEYYTDQTVRELRAILDGEGMVLSQFVVKTPNLSHPDPARRAASVDLFKRGVEGAYHGNAVAIEGFEDEYLTALSYLTGLAKEAGLKVE